MQAMNLYAYLTNRPAKGAIKMEHPNYYSILPANVRYDKRLGKPNAQILYSEITALSNKDGYCHASNGYFAKLYNVSNVTISRWLALLIDCGYLDREDIYYKGTKQVKERRLYPLSDPLNNSVKPPLNTNDKDNITSIKYYMITTYGKVVGNDLINKLELLSYTDDKQKLDTANVVIRFKDKLNSDLLLYGIKRTRDNQIAGKKIKNVAGYLTNVYKHWIEAGITEVAEAKAESEARYREDVDKEVYRDMYEAGYTDIADYKEAYGG